jgi:predicted Fe-Mo cluster-binding NifX family protein/uncharacterized membrane protein
MLDAGYRKLFLISDLSLPFIAMGISLLSSLVSLSLVFIERRAGKQINSQSLLANADEQKIDVVSSLAVFVSIGMTAWKVPYVEGVVIMLIALLIFKIGFQNGLRAIYGLMDANLHPELKAAIEDLINRIPGVEDVSRLKIRQAGPFVFAEAEIRVKKSADIVRAHTISEAVEKQVKERFAIVESVILHVEPYRSSRRRILIPTEEERGLESRVSDHFGRAQHFALVDIEGNEVVATVFKENRYRNKKIHAGLSAAHEVVNNRVDALVTQKLGEISFHTLRDHLVEIFLTKGTTLREVVENYLRNTLKPLTNPTHSSEREEESLLYEEDERVSGFRGKRMGRGYQLGRLGSIWRGEMKDEGRKV